ncbi:hypothetical protein ACLQ22_10140 [Micromonospora sp. DT178]|uniref:hypothetical protein n=1 Tax=Micromonospora sp. DT178 TaxID=3393436 RepID=UPI003CEA793A
MPIPPILFYLAAGAVGGVGVVGGFAGARFLYQRGQQEAAVQLQARDTAAVAQALRDEIDLAALREEARAAGVDPDQVEQGYYNLRDGLVTIDEAEAYLRTLDNP